MPNKQRCDWATHSEIEAQYHDQEWGVPSYDDRYLFELLTLEGAQAGLSWLTVLKKRQGYKDLFFNFDIEKVARIDAEEQAIIVQDARIIRHKGKIASTVKNAQAILNIQQEFGSFSDYLWSFVSHKPIQNTWTNSSEVPAQTELSQQLSKALKKRGFSFVGSTICYAYMQAVGLVNDHLPDCFCHPNRQR